MKTTLIYPNITRLERYGSKIGESGGSQQPLGIAYLGAYLRSHSVQVRLVDAEHENHSNEEVYARCKAFDTRVCGISMTTILFHKSIDLASYLKERSPEIIIVVGGSHISGNPRESMRHKCFDAGIIGEGEETLLEFIKSVETDKPWEDIDGLVFRKNGNIVINPPRKYISDLDTLPLPARDMLPSIHRYLPPPLNYKRRPCASMITTRGCPYSCTFCDNNTFGRKYRMRSAENIVEEIKHLTEDYGVKEIAFLDDTFNINDKRLDRLFSLMETEGIQLPWTCMARINTASYEQLRKMNKAGCWHISFGIESDDQKIIELIRKGIDLDYARKVIKWCTDLGIHTKGFFIIGHPGETEESIQRTLDYALSASLTDVVVTLNTPLPGSWNYDHREEYGTMSDVDWAKYNMWTPVFVPNGLTEDYMRQKHNEFIRKFYFRPSIILRHLMQFRNPSDVGKFINMFKTALAVLMRK